MTTKQESIIFNNHTNNSNLVENILMVGVNNRRDVILSSILKKENNQIHTIASRSLLSAPYTTVMELYDSWHNPTVKGGFLIKPDAMPFFLQPDATSLLLHFYRTARPVGKKIIAVAERFEDIPKQVIEYIPNIICLDKESCNYVSREISTVTGEHAFLTDEEKAIRYSLDCGCMNLYTT